MGGRTKRPSAGVLVAAYIIVEIDVHDPVVYERYRAVVSDIVARSGGKYLVRGGRAETLEGDWNPKRIVVLEFDDMQKARDWWSSPGYADAKRLRESCTRTRMILVEGV
jgi:uncharacterized protein (DUF1330 family)